MLSKTKLFFLNGSTASIIDEWKISHCSLPKEKIKPWYVGQLKVNKYPIRDEKMKSGSGIEKKQDRDQSDNFLFFFFFSLDEETDANIWTLSN